MTFLDRKEQVLDVQLTQHGKYLLSIGELKPEYYAFFDDDILYDSGYASIQQEQQNNIQDRIKESVRTKTQYVFNSIETNLKNKEHMTEKNVFLSPPISTISLTSNFAPA